MPWTSITGRPAALSEFTNDLNISAFTNNSGYITSSGTAAAFSGNLTGAVTSVGMVTTIVPVIAPANCGDATHTGRITYNAAGQIISCTELAIPGVSGSLQWTVTCPII
jgi:hypothetical protein